MSTREWANRAAKLRFGPNVVLREDDESTKAIFLEPPGGVPIALGSGQTWPDAMVDAVKHNAHISQPPPPPPEPAPAGAELIEEFCQAMRGRDLMTEFLLWYGEKQDQEPDAYPRALQRGGWFEFLSMFIGGIEK